MVDFKTKNIFKANQDNIYRVFVGKDKDPYANTIQILKNFNLKSAKGKKILLKPNAGRIAKPGEGITTNPRVIAAAIDAFQEAGAIVSVGESPIAGVKTMAAFRTAGISAEAEKRNCPLVDLDAGKYKTIELNDGQAIKSIKLCEKILEYDYIISIPVMKMHMHTKATLSVKNMKGCLWRRSKIDLHMLPKQKNSKEKPLDIAIADMSSVLQPHLSLIDGTVGMEGLGPSAGTPKPLDVVIASADAFAADAVAAKIMGTSAEEIPHLRIGAERGYGIINLDKMQIAPIDWEKWINPFAPPPENIAFDFPNIRVYDNNSCSACQSTLLLFLKHYGDIVFDYLSDTSILNIAIGKGNQDLPKNTFCMGNCTINHNKNGKFISGCPPVGSKIFQAISGKSIDIVKNKIKDKTINTEFDK